MPDLKSTSPSIFLQNEDDLKEEAIIYINIDSDMEDISEEDKDEPEKELNGNAGNQRKCLIMPSNPYKFKWDIWVIFWLIFTAMAIPYQVGFMEKPNVTW